MLNRLRHSTITIADHLPAIPYGWLFIYSGDHIVGILPADSAAADTPQRLCNIFGPCTFLRVIPRHPPVLTGDELAEHRTMVSTGHNCTYHTGEPHTNPERVTCLCLDTIIVCGTKYQSAANRILGETL